ncbi:hypothetical protein [Allorhizobium taibaishanense]|uniref:Uncharacterized protein n=1 Tax=Allorhizobium taibaishanense TaxID=887144 RepID=A0A7W6HQR7_9HYPH|nr:hypothetical protein [Allorhizobium taibaishanense]MBB4009699.1 hypothetical protein [Allorhizobium taibaishanense]
MRPEFSSVTESAAPENLTVNPLPGQPKLEVCLSTTPIHREGCVLSAADD